MTIPVLLALGLLAGALEVVRAMHPLGRMVITVELLRWHDCKLSRVVAKKGGLCIAQSRSARSNKDSVFLCQHDNRNHATYLNEAKM